MASADTGARVHTARALRAAGALLILTLAACGSDATGSRPLPPPLVYRAIATATARTCAVTEHGDIYCWGFGNSPAPGSDSTGRGLFPALVSGSLSFTDVSVGLDHACALTGSHAVYCWGAGARGQIGNHARLDVAVPTPVALDDIAVSIGVGDQFGCAVGTDQKVYCWGTGTWGQLGTAFIGDSAAPGTPRPPMPLFLSVTAGYRHACGVTADSTAFCWGANYVGQDGMGETAGIGLPFPVAGGLRFRQLSAGREHTCGITVGGQAYCWGNDDAGQVGHGVGGAFLTPVPVGGGLTFTAIAAGGHHTCALTPDGSAYCWGSNSDGQLGSDGPPFAQAAPVAVVGGHHFRRIAAGILHSCAVADDGSAWCWGFGGYGQLGNGSGFSESHPVRVLEPTMFRCRQQGSSLVCG